MTESAKLYKRAHDLHYRDENLDEAAVLYEQVIEMFPDTPEARYAATQLENIEAERQRIIAPALQPKPLEVRLAEAYQCGGCGHEECKITRLRMGGAPIYREAHGDPYLAVACMRCARVEFLDLSLIEGDRSTG